MSSLAQLEASSKYAKNGGQTSLDSSIDIKLWFDTEDYEKASDRLDMTTVSKLSFDENMFSVLPTMTFTLTDDGTYYNIKPLKIGRKVYVRIQSSALTDDNKEVEPILSRMTIESIEQNVNQASGSSALTVRCIYDCQGLINTIPTYPPEGQTISTLVPDNSPDTVTKVCGLVGLSCVADKSDLTDNMTWVNGSLTTKKFLDKIVDHAWAGENDAPLFYVDLGGTAHFTSIRTMTSQSSRISLLGQVQFNRQLSRHTAKEYYDNFLKPDSRLIYQGLKQVNLGAKISNLGAGLTKAAIYDPIGITKAALTAGTDGKSSFPDIRNTGISEAADTDYLSYDATSDTVFLGNSPNREADQTRKHTVTEHTGLASTNVHPYYEAALANNRTVKLAFFQNFWKLSLDLNQQPDYFYRNPSLFPRIGMLANVDFTNEDFDNAVNTGDYLITRVQHVWTPGNSYAVGLTIVAGGDYSA